jgi:hypothetical protein
VSEGVCYHLGLGVPVSAAEAARCFRVRRLAAAGADCPPSCAQIAAQSGDVRAENNMGAILQVRAAPRRAVHQLTPAHRRSASV